MKTAPFVSVGCRALGTFFFFGVASGLPSSTATTSRSTRSISRRSGAVFESISSTSCASCAASRTSSNPSASHSLISSATRRCSLVNLTLASVSEQLVKSRTTHFQTARAKCDGVRPVARLKSRLRCASSA